MKSKLFRKNNYCRQFKLTAIGILLLLLCPLALSAQGNGVTVSNPVVEAGSPTTVTFTVSWNRNTMPKKGDGTTILWLDSAWVFVDYYADGTAKRLPLLPGATLTETSAPGSAKGIQYPDNDRGVWVAGNAKQTSNSSGSFSATVQLFSAVASVEHAGVCAYASNYPPVGEYVDAQTIKFTGTPRFKIVLEPVPCKMSAVYNLAVSATAFCAGSEGVRFALSGTDSGVSYQLFRNNSAVDGAVLAGTGSAATFSGVFGEGAYTAQSIADGVHCPAVAMAGSYTVITENCCHAPGASGVTFAAFNPCSGADYGSTYTLTDGRDNKTYKVIYMPDGRYWMAQDLKFGELCAAKTTITSSSTASGNITASGTYYGDCCNNSLAAGGYYYNTTAAMNYGVTTANYRCSGTTAGIATNAPSTCRGICPENWHVPTLEEFQDLDTDLRQSSWCPNIQTCLESSDYFALSMSDGYNYARNSNDLRTSSSTSCFWWNYTSCSIGSGAEDQKSTIVRCARNY
jgi:uncharacterized protein (TIGR02145 family)